MPGGAAAPAESPLAVWRPCVSCSSILPRRRSRSSPAATTTTAVAPAEERLLFVSASRHQFDFFF